MTDIIWEDPPPADRLGRGSGSVQHAPIAEALKGRPGQWARAGVYDSAATAGTTALLIRSAKTRTYAPPGAFEAVARSVVNARGHREHRVYARYVGVQDA